MRSGGVGLDAESWKYPRIPAATATIPTAIMMADSMPRIGANRMPIGDNRNPLDLFGVTTCPMCIICMYDMSSTTCWPVTRCHA